MRKRKFTGSINGKGYYIALILCAVAIGISGYLFYRNANDTQPDPNQNVPSISDKDDNVPAVVTDPNDPTGTNPTDPDSGTTVPSDPDTGSKPGKRTRPVAGQTVAVFSMDALIYNATTRDWRVHNGIDLAAEAGTPVYAAADGTVYTVYKDEAMGMTVVIQHQGGYVTKYSSLAAEVSVEAGDTVTSGQVIGTVGNTALMESAIGDHIHFSVTANGEEIDPEEFLKN